MPKSPEREQKTAELIKKLLDQKLISAPQAEIAKADAEITGMTVDEVLIARRWVQEEALFVSRPGCALAIGQIDSELLLSRIAHLIGRAQMILMTICRNIAISWKRYLATLTNECRLRERGLCPPSMVEVAADGFAAAVPRSMQEISELLELSSQWIAKTTVAFTVNSCSPPAIEV